MSGNGHHGTLNDFDLSSLNGMIYAVRIYNRALTDEEVAQNYNEDKARFGF